MYLFDPIYPKIISFHHVITMERLMSYSTLFFPYGVLGLVSVSHSWLITTGTSHVFSSR